MYTALQYVWEKFSLSSEYFCFENKNKKCKKSLKKAKIFLLFIFLQVKVELIEMQLHSCTLNRDSANSVVWLVKLSRLTALASASAGEANSSDNKICV